jgi:hypothetical protein
LFLTAEVAEGRREKIDSAEKNAKRRKDETKTDPIRAPVFRVFSFLSAIMALVAFRDLGVLCGEEIGVNP